MQIGPYNYTRDIEEKRGYRIIMYTHSHVHFNNNENLINLHKEIHIEISLQIINKCSHINMLSKC